jgi:acyl carrier protein
MTVLADVISDLLVGKLEVEPEILSPTAEFEAMELDSLTLVQLAILLEKRFGIEIEESEIATARTIENTAVLLREKGVREDDVARKTEN